MTFVSRKQVVRPQAAGKQVVRPQVAQRKVVRPQAAQKQVVRPRAAAGIVLLRGASEEAEVLLGRRSASLRFMPGYYVFPGGRLDRADHRQSGFHEPEPEDPGVHADRTTRRLMAALRRAAIRETWEETGLLLGETGDGNEVRSPGPAVVWDHYHAMGAAPAFSALQYIARAITPPASPVRFHSRFFLCRTDDLTLQGELAGDGELEDLGWQPVSDLDPLPMADVTHAVLLQALRRLQDPDCKPCLFLYRQGSIRRR